MSLARNSLLLGSAQAIETGLQLLLPIVLVRAISADDFGDYRLLWLSISTVGAVAPFAMPTALYYFLPRVTVAERRRYVINTALFLAVGGAFGVLAIFALQGLLGGPLLRLERFGLWLPIFLVSWTAASLIDVLPSVDERFTWQAKTSIALSLLRASTAAVIAWKTQQVESVVAALGALAILKAILLSAYIRKYHPVAPASAATSECFKTQLRYAAPFGAASILFGLRAQSDQWIAASLFNATQYAAFSIASVLGPLVWLVRKAVTGAQMTAMNRRHAEGDLAGAIALNNSANLLVAAVVFPILAFVFLFAEKGVTLVYTSQFIAAGDVLRVLMVVWFLQVVELNSLLMLTRDGAASARINFALLGASIATSLAGAHFIGLPGAALGGCLSAFVERSLLVARISKTTGVSVAALQAWRQLVVLLLAAIACAGAAYLVTPQLIGAEALFPHLALAAFITFALYAATLRLSGLSRLTAARH